jgi:hypothetical protein
MKLITKLFLGDFVDIRIMYTRSWITFIFLRNKNQLCWDSGAEQTAKRQCWAAVCEGLLMSDDSTEIQ